MNDVTVILRVVERDAELLRAVEGREAEVRVLDGRTGSIYVIEAHVQRVGSLPDPEPGKPRRCPRCNSPAPSRHPAVQSEGEVSVCPDPWHDDPSTASIRERISS